MKNYETKTIPLTEIQEILKMMDYMMDRVNITCDRMDKILDRIEADDKRSVENWLKLDGI